MFSEHAAYDGLLIKVMPFSEDGYAQNNKDSSMGPYHHKMLNEFAKGS